MKTRTLDVRITLRNDVPVHVGIHDIVINTKHVLGAVQLDTRTHPPVEIEDTRQEA